MLDALNTTLAYLVVIWRLFGGIRFETYSLTHSISVNKAHVTSRVVAETIQKRSPLSLVCGYFRKLSATANCVSPLPLKQSLLQGPRQETM